MSVTVTLAKKAALDSHKADTSNPHNVTKAQVGLGNCDNTSDANKPISTATQAALDKIPLPHGPRRVQARLYDLAANGTARIRALVVGDSLAYYKPQFVLRHLNTLIGARATLDAQPTTPASWSPANGGGAFLTSTVVSGTFATNSGDGYTYWPTGPLPQLTSGSLVSFLLGGGNPYFSKLKVYYVRESGAGSFSILVGGSSVTTIDASNASVTLGSYEVTQSYGQALFQLQHASGGNVRIVGVIPSGDEAGVYHASVSVGGLSLASAMSSAQCRALFGAFVADWNPDIAFSEWDDDFSLTDAALLGDCLDNAATTDKVFIASTPKSGDQTSSARRDRWQNFVQDRGDESYFFFDGWTPVAPYSVLTSLGWEGDGTHPAFACSAYLSDLLIDQLGLRDKLYGYEARPANASFAPSRLGKNSEFIGPLDKLAVETDTYGYDWNLTIPRSLSVSTRGSYGTPSGAIFRVSGNTAAYGPNLLPAVINYGGLTAYRVATNSYIYFNTDGAANNTNALRLGVKSVNLPASTSTADGINAGDDVYFYRYGSGAWGFIGTGGTALRLDLLNTANPRIITDGSLTIQVGSAKTISLAAAATPLGTLTGTGHTFPGVVSNSGGIGYTTGAGGTVTQATSRTTPVTINKVSGDITLVSAAGSASWQSFTVTNSAVAATDSVRVVQKSGTDKYQIFVTAVGAGSFEITFATTGGTTTEQPVFHFDVFKGANS